MIELAKYRAKATRHFRIYFSALVYVFALGITVADTAAFGADGHDHHGQPCKVQHFQQIAGHGLESDSAVEPALITYGKTVLAPVPGLVTASPRRANAPRAPPSPNQT